MNPLQKNKMVLDFLNSVCSKIWNKNLHAQIRQELLNHLEDFVEEKISQGTPFEDAVELAVLKLGNPFKIGKEFNRVHRPWYLEPFALAISSVLLIFLGTLFFSQLSFWRAQSQSNDFQQIVSTKIDVFLEDQKIISQDPFFTEFGRKNDAGKFLNSRIAWIKPAHSPYSSLVSKWPDIVPPTELDVKLNGTWRNKWMEHANEVSFEKIDFSWMRNLNQYDHWDIFSHGPLSRAIKNQTADISPFSMPTPDGWALLFLAKLRLMKAVVDHKPLLALREVRQLAKLLLSQESYVEQIYATVLLELEMTAYETFLSQKLLRSSDWTPYEKKFISRVRRSLSAFTSLFSLNTSPEILKKVFLESSSRAGLCTALNNGMIQIAAVRDFMLNGVPFETRYEDKFALLNNIYEKLGPGCRLTYAKLVWKNTDEFTRTIYLNSQNSDFFPIWESGKYFWGRYIPFYRRALAAETAGLLTDNAFVSNYVDRD